MKDADFADGIYWILSAVDWKLGGGHDSSSGIDYRNSVFETFSFWAHAECNCTYDKWQWDISDAVKERMKRYVGSVEKHSSEWWRLYNMEHGNVTQGEERDHDPDCAIEDVHFRHFESGLEVKWYKRVGRSTESNKDMKILDWHKIIVECLESVRDEEPT